MFFGVGDAPGSRKIVWLGNFKINFTGIMIGIQSSIIVIPPSVIIIEIFRRLAPKKDKKSSKGDEELDNESFDPDRSDPESDDNQPLTKEQKERAEKNKKKGPFLLPNPFKYIAYFFVVACSGSSALVCFFYSMMWGPRKSNEWLASMFAGFFQSILVIQPIKAVFIAILLAAIFRKPVQQESAEEAEEKKKVRFYLVALYAFYTRNVSYTSSHLPNFILSSNLGSAHS